MREFLLTLIAACVAVPSADAVLLETGNDNTEAPSDDPGWDHVTRIGGLNGVYVGHGWMLTAGHVGIAGQSSVLLLGRSFEIVHDSRVVIEHAPGIEADLAAFRIEPYPPELPPLPLAGSTPALGDPVVLIGRGRPRGDWLDWGDGGYWWGYGGTKRWGTNHVGGSTWSGGSPQVTRDVGSSGGGITRALVTQFDPGGSAHEAVVTIGDSGGALFVQEAEGWALAGIHFALAMEPGQPAYSSAYGNDSYSVDLARYRDALLDVVRPCDDGRDNDGDGAIDLEDPGCAGPADHSEAPACSDAIDNDADGLVDHPADPDCDAPDDAVEGPDADGDGVVDPLDNCLAVANPDQLDTNADGFGNQCDADYDDDGIVGIIDLLLLIGSFGSAAGEPAFQAVLDATGDGYVEIDDFMLFSEQFDGPAGPSGLSCAGSAPCP